MKSLDAAARTFLKDRLAEMLAIPCPTGFTDEISRYICRWLENLNIEYKLTRRGTIIACLNGRATGARAIANHIDTIGATVSELKSNGRLGLMPVGSWSSRFAEGGKVTIFSQNRAFRGQVLPLLASGHAFNEAVDTLPIAWDSVEARVNEAVFNEADLKKLGINSGDFVAFDSDLEWSDNGYICARHLDNKAGAAVLLTALKLLREGDVTLELDLHAIFTVTEEVGTGAGASLRDDVVEFVGIDIGPVAPGQNAKETGATLCAQDTSGPYDAHLLKHLKQLCRQHDIDHQVDIFRYYYSDASSALKAGHDVRDALITFGTDATHGYERTHMNSLESLVSLIYHYSQSAAIQTPLKEAISS